MFFIGLIIGANMGILLASLCAVSARVDGKDNK